MRVVRLDTNGDGMVCFSDEARPKPAPGEVLVRIHACSLNYRDFFVVQGKMPFDDGRVPLSDGAGEVVSIGEGVSALGVGDRVVSVFYPYWTAWRGLVVAGRVKPGDIVLILGTGSVSLFALQLAKAAGARVIATTSSESKAELLRTLGADAVVNYRDVPQWGDAVRAVTAGRGVDHVIEVGGPATLPQSIAACRKGGHIALIGVLTGFAGEISIPALFTNQIRVSGVSIGSREDQQDLIRAIDATGLKPIVDRTFPFAEIGKAFRHFGTGRHIGKVCLEV